MNTFVSGLELRARNLGEMMERCAVDPVMLAREGLGLTLSSVARACIHCRHGEECRRWLEVTDRSVVKAPPAFCPNAGRFRGAHRR